MCKYIFSFPKMEALLNILNENKDVEWDLQKALGEGVLVLIIADVDAYVNRTFPIESWQYLTIFSRHIVIRQPSVKPILDVITSEFNTHHEATISQVNAII